MSMLTSMCDRLHATARMIRKRFASEGIYYPTIHDAANEMEDAAETILDLRNKCNDLQGENAKLRESYDNLRNAMWDRAHARAIQHMTEDELRATCVELFDYVDELKALAQRLYYCGQSDRECDRCGMNGANMHVKMSDVDYCDGINVCVRDLGIEVE